MRRTSLGCLLCLAVLAGCSSSPSVSLSTQEDVTKAAELGMQYMHAGDMEKAVAQLSVAAEPNKYRQQGIIGQLSADLTGQKLSSLKADAEATRQLALLYMQGRGVERDPAKAVALYLGAAMQGDSSAQVSLGRLYEKGTGVDYDTVMALAFYTLAADAKNSDGERGARRLAATMSAEDIGRAQALHDQLKNSMSL